MPHPKLPSLTGYSDAELEAELQVRKAKAEKDARPKPLPEPDFAGLSVLATDEIEHIAEHGRSSREIAHYCYEAVMEAVYSGSVWDWINDRLQ
jgi:hypothetical protein